jgi:ABC-type Co2+ transport system permease subunit
MRQSPLFSLLSRNQLCVKKEIDMHIEPGVVDGAKMILGYATAAGAVSYAVKKTHDTIKRDGVVSLAARASLATVAVFCFFEVFPHHAVGVSEVHLIMGSTLFLVFGLAPAAIGLVLGLMIQGLFFAPFDLPQYGINVTTLLVPLFAMGELARRIIPTHTTYKDISYLQALKLSTAYQGGIVVWVAFWALYGQGFGAENLANVAAFGAAYMMVIIVEPLADLAILALAKVFYGFKDSIFVEKRLYATD